MHQVPASPLEQVYEFPLVLFLIASGEFLWRLLIAAFARLNGVPISCRPPAGIL